MSHSTSLKFTRRSVLVGTASGIAIAGLPLGTGAAAKSAQASSALRSSSLCASHHLELSRHMRDVLDAAYIDEHAKNKMLRTTVCPHCKVGIHPAEKAKPEFTALAA